MQDEINEKVIALSIRTTKLTAEMLQKSIRFMLSQIKKQLDKPVQHHGKQTLKQLMKQNAGVSSIEITDSNIKAFESTAKKYGVDFALKKDATESPPRYLVFFKGRDADVLTAAFQEFSARKLTQEQKPSIRKALNTLIANTKGSGEKSGEDFWVKAERLLYCALIGYGVPCSFWRAFKAAVNASGRKLSISLKRAAKLSAPPLGR